MPLAYCLMSSLWRIASLSVSRYASASATFCAEEQRGMNVNGQCMYFVSETS